MRRLFKSYNRVCRFFVHVAKNKLNERKRSTVGAIFIISYHLCRIFVTSFNCVLSFSVSFILTALACASQSVAWLENFTEQQISAA